MNSSAKKNQVHELSGKLRTRDDHEYRPSTAPIHRIALLRCGEKNNNKSQDLGNVGRRRRRGGRMLEGWGERRGPRRIEDDPSISVVWLHR